ncbi:hypothetical protein ACT44T_19535 (plasmid) [Acinetobacter baumannii]
MPKVQIEIDCPLTLRDLSAFVVDQNMETLSWSDVIFTLLHEHSKQVTEIQQLKNELSS